MKNQKKSVLIISGLILIAALSRLLPHPPNFTSVGATALFGAAYFTKKYWAFIIPVAALWISDLILNNVFLAQYYDGFAWFTDGFVWIAGSFIVVTTLGMTLLKKVTIGNVIGSSVIASTIFFLLTNFGTWLSSGLYAQSFGGLMTCYAAGLPFFWNTLAGNLFYAGVLFGAYQMIKNYSTKLELA